MSGLLAGLLALFRPAPPVVPTREVAPFIPGATGRPPSLITPALLLRLGVADPAGWAPTLAAACQRREITTEARVAEFLAEILHETGGLKVLVESLDYAPQGLADTWPSRFALPGGPPWRPNARALLLGRGAAPAQQQAIAEAAYGNRADLGNTAPGDGWRFRGRGLIQLTGRANYRAFAEAIGVSLEALPALLETRTGAAESAAHYWQVRGCNALADAGDTTAVRRRVNGGTIGLADVQLRRAAALQALGAAA